MLNFAKGASLVNRAALGALLCAAAPAFADVKAGVTAYQKGDYAAAIREWRPLADRGDADAQFNLAQAHRLGRGVPTNLNMAIDLYRKAATQNHAEAEALLALALFQNGRRAEAMPWLAKAADRGDASSQFVYGTALFNGDLVKQDMPRAYSLMTRAAAQGLPPARDSLREMDKHIPLAQRQAAVALITTTPAPVRTASAIPAPRPNVRTDSRLPARPAEQPKANANQKLAAQQRPVVPPKLAAAPKVTPAPKMTVAVKSAAGAKPVTKVVARPAPAAAATRISGWKIQLGAFKEAGSANALFTSLKGRVPALGGAQPLLVRAGVVTRLQAGPFASRAAATAACAAVRTRTGQACFAVAP